MLYKSSPRNIWTISFQIYTCKAFLHRPVLQTQILSQAFASKAPIMCCCLQQGLLWLKQLYCSNCSTIIALQQFAAHCAAPDIAPQIYRLLSTNMQQHMLECIPVLSLVALPASYLVARLIQEQFLLAIEPLPCGDHLHLLTARISKSNWSYFHKSSCRKI